MSAGANIAHNLAMVVEEAEFGTKVNLVELALVHPFFWGSNPIGSESVDPGRRASVDWLWPFVCPSAPDSDDP